MDTHRAHLPASLAEVAGPPIAADALADRLADRRAGPATDQVQVVLWAWAADAALETTTVARIGELAARYARRLAATDVNSLFDATLEDAEGFVWAPTQRGRPPAPATCHLRRTTLRTLYRTLRRLDATYADPTLDLQLPPKTIRAARPLDDAEIGLLRLAARARRRNRDRAAAAVALAEATATTSEIPQVVWRDLDLTAGSVHLPGATPVRSRTGLLSSWGVATLRAQTDTHEADLPLVHRGEAPPDSHAAQATTNGLLRRLLDTAGLTDPDIKPSSVRLWRPARDLAAGGRVEHAARQLGLASLDVTAEVLGHRWQDQP